jgi:hypothetical protein
MLGKKHGQQALLSFAFADHPGSRGELLRLAVDAEIVDAELMNALLKRARRTERLLLGMRKQRREFSP